MIALNSDNIMIAEREGAPQSLTRCGAPLRSAGSIYSQIVNDRSAFNAM